MFRKRLLNFENSAATPLDKWGRIIDKLPTIETYAKNSPARQRRGGFRFFNRAHDAAEFGIRPVLVRAVLISDNSAIVASQIEVGSKAYRSNSWPPVMP